MRLVLALLVLSLAVSLPAAPSPTCTEIASSRQRVTLDSPRAGRGFMVTVILPPCAEEHYAAAVCRAVGWLEPR
ncbi:MAG: hypothetical protein HND48_25185 [Chloroflexi bacterium]|nr:hypothetical protein [Chloroflexota bacterium]